MRNLLGEYEGNDFDFEKVCTQLYMLRFYFSFHISLLPHTRSIARSLVEPLYSSFPASLSLSLSFHWKIQRSSRVRFANRRKLPIFPMSSHDDDDRYKVEMQKGKKQHVIVAIMKFHYVCSYVCFLRASNQRMRRQANRAHTILKYSLVNSFDFSRCFRYFSCCCVLRLHTQIRCISSVAYRSGVVENT